MRVSVPLVVGVVACGEPQAPEPVGTMPELTVEVGGTESVDLAGYFSDPDGDVLAYSATTSDAGVATASVSGSEVTVSGVSPGTAEVTVTATDPGGLLATQAFTVTVPSADWEVLEILYDELDGDNWRNNTNWLTSAPLDEWYGVSTDAEGRVDALDLWGNSLTGAIPSELGNLASLEGLHFPGNSLTGEIPPELGDLSSLRELHLDVNQLTGEIPPEFLALSSLLLFYWDDNDGLCAPNTSEFDEWLRGLFDWVGPRCD